KGPGKGRFTLRDSPAKRGPLSASQKRAWARLTFAIRFIQTTKVIAHRRQSQCFGKPVAMFHERAAEEAPELNALTIKNSQLNHDPHQGCGPIHQVIVLWLGRSEERRVGKEWRWGRGTDGSAKRDVYMYYGSS